MSGVAELSLPRFSITTLNQEGDATHCDEPKTVQSKGRYMESGPYRLQYSDEVEIPRAQIDSE